MKIDEDILKDLAKENILKDISPLYDIKILGNSIMFRLSPYGGYYAVNINTYKMMLREKKLGELLP